MEQIPIVALCGFLGSGKTTLLRRWRRDEAIGDAAFIVHDLSELGVDAELLSEDDKALKAGVLNGRVAALHGSHAREDLHTSLSTSLNSISKLDPQPSLVLSESTGVAHPWPLIRALTQDDRFFLRHFIVTVDALNLHRDYEDGLVLMNESQDKALNHATQVLAEQVLFASIIILTKVDTLPKSVIEAQVRNLQKLQPKVTIALSAYAGLLLPQLDNVPSPSLSTYKEMAEQFGLSQQASTAENVDVTLLKDPRPFHPERLHQACQNNLGTGLYRTKGFLWMASRPGHVLLWQQAGSQISLELQGQWRAEIFKDEDKRLFPEELEALERRLSTEHPVFGDRFNELTLIGLEADRKAFYTALQDALCTDEEIEAWQQGQAFSDPWPTSLRKAN